MIVTEEVHFCECGAKPVVISHQNGLSNGWWCHVYCLSCKNNERDTHESIENAVKAWNSTFK